MCTMQTIGCKIKLLSLLCGLYFPVAFCTGYHEKINEAIFVGYDSGLKPVCVDVTQVNATIGIGIRQVIDLDEPNQVIKLNMWIRLKWNDCKLQWNASEYGGITNIIVPYKRLWVPDLTLYPSISTNFHGMVDYKPTVYSDGTVYYNFPTVIEALCPVDVTNFPFDSQICALKFGSWSYHGFSLDFKPRSTSAGDLSSMKPNVEWEVPNVTIERHVVFYKCCPEPYPDVTFYIHLRRKPSFYITNIIIPSLMITVLVLLGFILPVSSGEKVSLEITVMLAMSVFQLLVADKLPPSADSTPWIGIFFNYILGLSGVSTILQVIVINVFYRDQKNVPNWMMNYVIVPACLITFVEIPRHNSKYHAEQYEIQEDIKDKKKVKEVDNSTAWQCFSNAIDRLGLFCFSLTLAIGCIIIFNKLQSLN